MPRFMLTVLHRCRSLCIIVFLSWAKGGKSFKTGAKPHTDIKTRTRTSSMIRLSTTTPGLPSTIHTLQRVCNDLVKGAELQDVEKLVLGVEADIFPQASAWAKTWTPMRCMIAEVPDRMSLSVLILPRGAKLDWQRHDEADSISRVLFGSFKTDNLELQGSDSSRKLEQQELEATYTDAWAVGGSDESDCVCRGGRCPRMWDCPFWVDRRRAEAKGSSAHIALRASKDFGPIISDLWRAGQQTVRLVEALEPSALLEVHVGPRNTRYYQEIPSQVEKVVELIEVLTPPGVRPGVCRYLGPTVDIPE